MVKKNEKMEQKAVRAESPNREIEQEAFEGTYGAALAIKVVLEIWARIGALKAGLDEEAQAKLRVEVENFLNRFDGVTDEAVAIELKSWFDRLLGAGENPNGFSRLMAARFMRLMVEEYARALEEEARKEVEGAAGRRAAVEADEVNYLPDDESDLSEMGLVAASR